MTIEFHRISAEKYATLALESLCDMKNMSEKEYKEYCQTLADNNQGYMYAILSDASGEMGEIGILMNNSSCIWGLGLNPIWRDNLEVLTEVATKCILETPYVMYLPQYLASEITKTAKYYMVYSRARMQLPLAKFTPTTPSTESLSADYHHPTTNAIDELRDILADSFSHSIDEKFGLFQKDRLNSYLMQVFTGKYGNFLPDISLFGADAAILITEYNKEVAFIPIIGVRRRKQSHGIGSALITRIAIELRAKGYTFLELWVTTQNEGAFRAYCKLGFQQTSDTEVKLTRNFSSHYSLN